MVSGCLRGDRGRGPDNEGRAGGPLTGSVRRGEGVGDRMGVEVRHGILWKGQQVSDARIGERMYPGLEDRLTVS